MKKTNPAGVAAIAVSSVAIAGFAALYGGTKFLVDVALKSKPPKIYEKISHLLAGENNDDKRQNKKSILNSSAGKLDATGMEKVSTISFDGLELKGRYYRCQNPKRIIVCCHGWRSSAGLDFGITMDFLHNSDCDVLFIDQRAQNGSNGGYMGFGSIERYDCQSWVNWVNDNTEKLPVYLYGISMGSASVMMSSSLVMPERLHGIIADCGFTSVYDICSHVAKDNLHLPFKLQRFVAKLMFDRRVGEDCFEQSALDALAVTNIPLLFIHGDADTFVPVEMTYKNYEACNSQKRMLIVPGADHAGSYMKDPDKYEKSMLDFWKDFDGI